MRRCKNGARNTLFLWVGTDSSPDTRAALAIQSVHVTGEDVAADHVQVSQGSEPPLLAAVCAHMLGRPLCVVRGVSEAPAETAAHFTCVLEVSMLHLGLPGQCPAARQVQSELLDSRTGGSVQDMSAERARICLEVDVRAKNYSLQLYMGVAALPSVVDAANSVMKMAGDLVAASLGEWEAESVFVQKGDTKVGNSIEDAFICN
jgi:hypothetical protein